MAITVTDRGTGNDNTSATTVVITPGANFAAGSMAVLVLAYDNQGTNGADPYTSIADSVGNVWHSKVDALYDPAGAGAGATLRIFTSHMVTAAITTSNTITVSFGAVSPKAKAWTLTELVPSAGKFIQFLTGAANAGAATGTPTVTSSSITSGDVIIGGGASEGADNWTGDADSTNGSWSTKQSNAAGTGATGQAVVSQSKVVTGTATQTFNPTLTSADCILAWASFTETTLVGWKFSVNCRATAGYVTDDATETYSLANTDAAYPLNRGRNTFGYTAKDADSERDRNAGIDRRFAGLHQRPNNTAAQNIFRVDLPAAGNYLVRVAFGDYDNDQIQYFEVFDNASSKFSQSNVSSTTQNFVDAGGNLRSVAAWPGSNTAQTGLSFTSGICIIKYGKNGSGTLASTMAHFEIEKEADSAAYTLTAAQGSYSLTGQATGLTSARKLAAAQGSYALTGQAVALKVGHTITAAQGSYALTGNATAFKVGHTLTAAKGDYSLTGNDVTLTYTPSAGPAAYSLTAAQGSYALTGFSATLSASNDVASNDPWAPDPQPIRKHFPLRGELKPKRKRLTKAAVKQITKVAELPEPTAADLTGLAQALMPAAGTFDIATIVQGIERALQAALAAEAQKAAAELNRQEVERIRKAVLLEQIAGYQRLMEDDEILLMHIL